VIGSAEEFVQLCDSEWKEDRARADHEGASDEVWRNIVEWYPRVRLWVARNKTVPVHILEILARDPERQVRKVVAAKRKLTPGIQLILACDPEERVREILANNPRATKEALERIAGGERGVAARAAAARLRGT
jgi:hypothetical protein